MCQKNERRLIHFSWAKNLKWCPWLYIDETGDVWATVYLNTCNLYFKYKSISACFI